MQQDSSHPEGVSGDDHVPGVVRARERKANAALQLRTAGADWEQIAEIMGYPTPRQALVAVEKALERELQTETSQAKMRVLAGRRLEQLLRASWSRAMDPSKDDQLSAIARAQSLTMDHAKLFGYVAPQEVVVHSPSQTELEAWVARVVQAEVPAIEEGNIFDADWTEEDEDEYDESA